MNSSPKPQLYSYEWSIVLIFCSVVLLLAAQSWKNRERQYVAEYTEELPLTASYLTLSIEGAAVENPGMYQVKRGSTVGQALEHVKIREEADLSRLKLKSKVKSKQKIKIPVKKLPVKRKHLRNNPSV